MHFFNHVAARRQYLDKALTSSHSFGALEESCAPAYVHPNLPAAWVTWMRLFRAAGYFHRYRPGPQVLDFGAGTGELFHLLAPPIRYCYAEETAFLADYIAAEIPGSIRVDEKNLERQSFDAIFALDSLEHCDDPDPIIGMLHKALRPAGLFILSGPTENYLYRLGRRIAGFTGHYHETNIYNLESLMEKRFRRIATTSVPFAVPLFRISCWQTR